MDDSLRRFVQARAAGKCEYCHFPEAVAFLPFQLDHIIAEKHGGPTEEGNLAWACYYCNSFKGPNLAGWIAETGQIVRLFHPRTDVWSEHFLWEGPILRPRTLIGQATIQVLSINHPDASAVRGMILDVDGRLE
jgi:hypothetical protein